MAKKKTLKEEKTEKKLFSVCFISDTNPALIEGFLIQILDEDRKTITFRAELEECVTNKLGHYQYSSKLIDYDEVVDVKFSTIRNTKIILPNGKHKIVLEKE